VRALAIRTLGVVAVGLTVMLIGHWLTEHAEVLDRLAAGLKAWSGLLLGWRLGLIGGLVLLWPAVAERLGRRRGLGAGQAARLIEARWTLGLALLAFEAVVVQGTGAELLAGWLR
jgi:hypothetical protein